MAEKMAERIAEILKGPNFQTAEKALTDFCGTMDGGIQESSGGYYCGTMD